MKKSNKRIEIVAVLALAVLCLSLNFGNLASAQDNNRQRVFTTPTPTPKKSPKPTATPKQTPTPKPTATPIAAPTATPTPIPTPTATPTAIPIQSLPELQSKIRLSLTRPELQRGQVGIKIVSLDTGQVIFEQNSEKYFMPASNMKSFTVATAMERLTPDFRFATSIYANSMPDANGVISGDLTIYGRGDPSFAIAFTKPDATTPATESDYLKGIQALADKIVQSGVKRIEGNLIGDESYFNTEPIPNGWEWDDLQWYYGAEVSALTINDNAVDLKITPSLNGLGLPCNISISPANNLFTIINLTQTVSAGNKRAIEIYKRLNSNVLEIRGTMPSDDKGYTGYIAVTKPAELFTALLKNELQKKGVTVTGQTKTINYKQLMDNSRAPSARSLPALNLTNSVQSNRVEITKLESPPFSIIAAKTMKPSQNLYTELILRALGEQIGDKTDPKKTSEDRGIEAVQSFLTQAGIASGSVVQFDGCGLSRHDLITPAAAVQLYTYMSQRPYAQTWRDSLTIGGVDGTLENRFKGTAAANNVRGKTGTIDQVSALSGYITTASGERLVFSILTNGIPQGRIRTATIDEIVVSLANFSGKTN